MLFVGSVCLASFTSYFVETSVPLPHLDCKSSGEKCDSRSRGDSVLSLLLSFCSEQQVSYFVLREVWIIFPLSTCSLSLAAQGGLWSPGLDP